MTIIRVIAAAIVIAWAGLAAAEEPRNPAIEGTIQSQIEAFKADDFDTAFTFASPNIQGIFRDPGNFGRMVRNGYPMVWRPAEVEYLELRDVAGLLWQKVRIVDGKGVVHILDYQMIEGENGWKINGVQLLKGPAVSA